MTNKDVIIAQLLRQNEQQTNQIRLLTEQNIKLHTENQELRERIARLEKNSLNSSKPPSSDIINPKPTLKNGCKRRRGGQRGHKKHSREPFTPDQIDKTVIYELSKEEISKRNLIELNQTEATLQQVELPTKLFSVIEHRVKLYRTLSGRIIRATIPKHIRKEGFFTSSTTAFVGYCKARCHMSYSTITGLFSDIVGLQISESFLINCCNKKLSNALIPVYCQALEYIRNASIVGTDETGHKDSGNKYWTWCQHADGVAFFRICDSRGSKVLFENLGKDFNSILLADYYSANRMFVRLTKAKVQWCWAHLIRDIRFLADLGKQNLKKWSDGLIAIIDKILKTWRNGRERQTKYFEKKLAILKKLFLCKVLRPPNHHDARRIKKRFTRKDKDGYFLFLENPNVEPTNNSTEQKIRFVVLDRRVTQGTNSEAGMRFYERVWTVIATCTVQQKNIFNFFRDSLKAYYANIPTPSLIP